MSTKWVPVAVAIKKSDRTKYWRDDRVGFIEAKVVMGATVLVTRLDLDW